jgi:hypothetical protein
MATDCADEKVTDVSGFTGVGVIGVSSIDVSSRSMYWVISTARDCPNVVPYGCIPARTSVENALWCNVPGAERRWSLVRPTRTVIMLKTMDIMGEIWVANSIRADN